MEQHTYAMMPYEDYLDYCNAIRERTGRTNKIKSGETGDLVRTIEDDPVLQSKTIAPTIDEQTITADDGYDGLDVITVSAIPTTTQAMPDISISSSGLITASVSQSEGYVSEGIKSNIKQLDVQAEKTVTPTTIDQIVIASGIYTIGDVVVEGDSNLVADNIRSGVSIFGVTGTLEENTGSSGLELEGDFLKYVAYQLDNENKEIIICGILYYQLYADTGSYDVNIPAKFGEYNVVIDSMGVG